MKPGFIDVTDVPLEALARAAYEPSMQQGLGVFDQRGKADLSDEIVAAWLVARLDNVFA